MYWHVELALSKRRRGSLCQLRHFVYNGYWKQGSQRSSTVMKLSRVDRMNAFVVTQCRPFRIAVLKIVHVISLTSDRPEG